MAIARDLDIKISYLLNVIFPASIGVSIIFGLVSTVSFFYYCYQLSRSCLKRSNSFKQAISPEDYLHNNYSKSLEKGTSDMANQVGTFRLERFNSLKEAFSSNNLLLIDDVKSSGDIKRDMASAYGNSGKGGSKIDSEKVQRNLKKSMDFSKDSIHSPKGHKSHLTDLKNSSQYDRREQHVVSEGPKRSIENGRYMPGYQISDVQKEIRQGNVFFTTDRKITPYASDIRKIIAREKRHERSSNASVQSPTIRESGV
ncbi:MAG: hypothetical protein MHMPM18_001871 [Marteilia pararefringens]